MAESKRLFNLAETKGSFEIVGKVQDTQSDRFFDEKVIENKAGKKTPLRNINFGLVYDNNEMENDPHKVYVSLNGYQRDKVYCSGRFTGKDGKSKIETKQLSWKDRYNVPEGYAPIGIKVGLEKQIDEKGAVTNVRKTLYEFDACGEIHEKLMDNQSVYVRGDIQAFTTSKGEHRQAFNIKQVSLLKSDITYGEGFEPKSHFKLPICFKSIEKSDENENEFIICGYIISYSTIEEVELITRNKSLANNFKKNMKPYYYIELWGDIEVTTNVETVTEEDTWGEECAMDKQAAPSKVQLVVTGAKPSTIDKTLYSEEEIDKALAAIRQSKTASKDYGKKVSEEEAGFEGGWGDDEPEDEEDWG